MSNEPQLCPPAVDATHPQSKYFRPFLEKSDCLQSFLRQAPVGPIQCPIDVSAAQQGQISLAPQRSGLGIEFVHFRKACTSGLTQARATWESGQRRMSRDLCQRPTHYHAADNLERSRRFPLEVSCHLFWYRRQLYGQQHHVSWAALPRGRQLEAGDSSKSGREGRCHHRGLQEQSRHGCSCIEHCRKEYTIIPRMPTCTRSNHRWPECQHSSAWNKRLLTSNTPSPSLMQHRPRQCWIPGIDRSGLKSSMPPLCELLSASACNSKKLDDIAISVL